MGRAFFGGGKVGIKKPTTSRLPDGFTELVYIESSGEQYFNTEFNPKYNTRVVMDISDLSAGAGWLFGARDTSSSSSTNRFGLTRVTSNDTVRSDYWGGNKSTAVSDTEIGARTIIDKNANVLTMWGYTVTHTAVSSGECSQPMYLLALNNAGTVYSSKASCKLYSCQIYDNGTLVRDFVPCLSDADGVGLYDLVNNKFYGNAGTGSFVGSEVAA